jgi:RND family efflux transporter MFP subunit
MPDDQARRDDRRDQHRQEPPRDETGEEAQRDQRGQDRSDDQTKPGGHHQTAEPQELPKADPGKLRWAAFAGVALFALVLVVGVVTRVLAGRDLHATTQTNDQQIVTAVHPQPVKGTQLVLPARLDAWFEAPVYARTNGYLRKWYADIGTPVRAGQVLADIDTPEVDQQLAASEAALATAQAQLNLAATTATRWTKLLAQNAVSKQDADDRTGDYAAKLAMRNQAQADVQRLKALTGFQEIVAPFDGVVTGRNTDVGDLIVAGSAARPLFTVADVSRLRVYVSVPQSDLAAIKPGLQAHFTVPEMPGRSFSAEIARTAGSVDPQSGAMLVQLVYDNGEGLLKPGAYADLSFDLPSRSDHSDLLQIPADALLFRKDGTTVAVVGQDGTVSIHKISIATDLGTELQVNSGLTRDDWVIDSPSDGIEDGDHVHLQPPSAKPHA